MRPIVQHMGQPFHKKRTAGRRMTDSHSALFMVRTATYSAARPRIPRMRWIPMVLLPRNTLAPFPLRAAGFHRIELRGPYAALRRGPPSPSRPHGDFIDFISAKRQR